MSEQKAAKTVIVDSKIPLVFKVVFAGMVVSEIFIFAFVMFAVLYSALFNPVNEYGVDYGISALEKNLNDTKERVDIYGNFNYLADEIIVDALITAHQRGVEIFVILPSYANLDFESKVVLAELLRDGVIELKEFKKPIIGKNLIVLIDNSYNRLEDAPNYKSFATKLEFIGKRCRRLFDQATPVQISSL